MKNLSTFSLLFSFVIILAGCKTEEILTQLPKATQAEVVINDIPYQTEKFLRVPYTLKTWEWEKDGLVLQQIIVLDSNTKTELMNIDKAHLPFIHKSPLKPNPYYLEDNLKNYYFSIQVPLPLGQAKPAVITHRFIFRDTVKNTDVILEGGSFHPRYNESPLVIASPVKGKNWLFMNHSTLKYHFYTMFFVNGRIERGERFAFDNMQFDDNLEDIASGDPAKNESYHCYKDTLYAVKDGVVYGVHDGRTERDGNTKNVPINSTDELGGNYLVLDIGGGYYAFYAHCVKNSFFVKAGDNVKEGQPLALLGNSGNSDAPHLHFEITNGKDILLSYGQPYVFKSFTKIAAINNFDTYPEGGLTRIAPTVFNNIMMEQTAIINFE